MLNFRRKKKVRWEDVANFQIDSPKAVKTFTDKLFEEYAWNPMFSKTVIEEYKKFMFLIATNPGQSFTPSKYVDRVWHVHLQYTKNYWKEFCVLLGREIHHHPGDGSPVKEETFRRDYQKTLRIYEETFGHPAPENVWGRPKEKVEKKSNTKTVVASIIPLLFLLSIGGWTIFLILAGIIGLALIIYAIVNALSDNSPDYSSSYYSSKKKRKNSSGSSGRSSSGGDTTIYSSCSSGCSSGSHSSHSDSGFGGGDSDGGGSSGDSGGDGGSSCGSSCGGGCGGGD